MNNSAKLLLLGLALAASPASAKLLEDTVASVNGQPILLSEYQKEAATAVDYWSKMSPGALADPANLRKLRESTLEQLIDRELLIQEGARLKLKVREREIDNAVDEIKARFKKNEKGEPMSDAEAEAAFRETIKKEGLDWGRFRERLSRQIMARKVLDEAVKSKMTPPTDEETREYFKKVEDYIASKSTEVPKGMEEEDGMALREVAGQVKALSSERVRVQRILIRVSPGASENERNRAKKTAEGLKKRLDEGEDFAKVAKEESEDPESAARGGDLGYVLRGVAPPELEKAAFSLTVGETSAPIFTESGYNVIRVTEKRAAEKPEYEKFKDELANFLGGVSFQKKIETFVKGLRDKATIERNLQAAAAP